MASTSFTISNLSSFYPLRFSSHRSLPLPLPFPHSNSPKTTGLVLCAAAKSQTGPVPKKKKQNSNGRGGGAESGRSDGQSKSKAEPSRRRGSDIGSKDDVPSGSEKGTSQKQSRPRPKPPAGFVLDAEGRVLEVSKNRVITIVDPDTNKPLDCIARRVFKSSRGDECALVSPVDMPISILKSTNFAGWTSIDDEEIEAVLPTADYILARIHMHLVYSGFCNTVRGGFAYKEDVLFKLDTDDGETEALEITCFHLDGSHYMIYTPVDPLTFVAIKDDNGVYQPADDELSEDPAVSSAIDEENDFNEFAQEEEAALVEILNNGGI